MVGVQRTAVAPALAAHSAAEALARRGQRVLAQPAGRKVERAAALPDPAGQAEAVADGGVPGAGEAALRHDNRCPRAAAEPNLLYIVLKTTPTAARSTANFALL